MTARRERARHRSPGAAEPPAPGATAGRWRGATATVALAVATGALLALASPACGASPLVWLVLMPSGVAACRARSGRGALAVGALHGAAATAAISWWLVGAVHEYHGIPPVLGWPLFAAYALIGQLQFPAWAVIRWWLRDRHDPPAILALAAAYAGLDWLAPKLFRDTLAVACYADPHLIQLVDLGGPFLLTFAIAAVSQAVVAGLARRRAAAPAGVLAAAVLAIAMGYGELRRGAIRDAVAAAPRRRAAVAQANVGTLDKLASERGATSVVMDVLRRYGELSDRQATGPTPPDLLVWPETSYPLAWQAHRSTLDDDVEHEIETYAHERNVAMVFGGYHRVDGTEYNSAIALAPDGASSVYHKFVLVPFAETYPFPVSLIRPPRFGAGGTARTLDVSLPGPAVGAPPRGKVRIAPVICYEALVPSHALDGVRAGAQLIVNLTNDAWFVSVAEQRLHLASSVLRSVETRRAQVRATNTGITALILPDGELVSPGAIDAEDVLAYDVPLLDAGSPALALGAWAGPGLAALAALALVALALRGRRS